MRIILILLLLPAIWAVSIPVKVSSAIDKAQVLLPKVDNNNHYVRMTQRLINKALNGDRKSYDEWKQIEEKLKDYIMVLEKLPKLEVPKSAPLVSPPPPQVSVKETPKGLDEAFIWLIFFVIILCCCMAANQPPSA